MTQYQILEVLGQGGMGVVYKAMDPVLHRTVAIKVFHENLVKQDIVIKRFKRESEISSKLDHPNIVKIYSFEQQDKKSLLIMEYIEGQPLLSYVKNHQVSLEGKLQILIKVANALHYAHKKQIIHRDIKPSNIMIRQNGEPVVMDFGIAKCIGLDELTRTGEFVGTIQYVALEQAEGHRRDLDHRADIYSLGAVMYHLLTDRPPVDATTFSEMLYQLAYEQPVLPHEIKADISPDLEQICLKALAKDKNQRYVSTKAFADDIQNYLSGKKTHAAAWFKKNIFKRLLLRCSLFLGILLAILFIIFGSYSYSQYIQQKLIQDQFLQKIEQINLKKTDPTQWETLYENLTEAFIFYQQNKKTLNDPQREQDLQIDLVHFSYQLGISCWQKDAIQSAKFFSGSVATALPETLQPWHTKTDILATDVHLQYLNREYQKVCEKEKDIVKIIPTTKKITDLYPEVSFLIAKSYFYCSDYFSAINRLNLLETQPLFEKNLPLKAELAYYQGLSLYYLEEYSQAQKAFELSEEILSKNGLSAKFYTSLLIYLGDTRLQGVSYAVPLNELARKNLYEIVTRIRNTATKQPLQFTELALYYELQARSLLSPVITEEIKSKIRANNKKLTPQEVQIVLDTILPTDGEINLSEKLDTTKISTEIIEKIEKIIQPSTDQIEQALEAIQKSSEIIPWRYSQHIMRGIAFLYLGRSNADKYPNAYQDAFKELDIAIQLNPKRGDSTLLMVNITSECINYDQDQLTDIIIHLQRWNLRMYVTAADLHDTKMKKLGDECRAQLESFSGNEYSDETAAKFYSLVQSTDVGIQQLGISELVNLVDVNSQNRYQSVSMFLENKLKNLSKSDPSYTNLLDIKLEIERKKKKESYWGYLYFLSRIPYYENVPEIILNKCRDMPEFIIFLQEILQNNSLDLLLPKFEQNENCLFSIKENWLWLQYFVARFLSQYPYNLAQPNSQPIYSRQILYEAIVNNDNKLPTELRIVIAKALQDSNFRWWDRSLILDWFEQIWDNLKKQDDPQQMWLQTMLAGLLITKNDPKIEEKLITIYDQTKYPLVKAWIVHELLIEDWCFTSDIAVEDWTKWLNETIEQANTSIFNISQVRHVISQNIEDQKKLYILNLINTRLIATKIKQKDEKEKKGGKEVTEFANTVAPKFIALLKIKNLDIQIYKAVLNAIFSTSELYNIWAKPEFRMVERLSEFILKSDDQELRLLAIAVSPLQGDFNFLVEILRQSLPSRQKFVEKLAFFYGLAINIQNIEYEDLTKNILEMFFAIEQAPLRDERLIGWLFTILCNFYYFIENRITSQTQLIFKIQLPQKILEYLKSPSPILNFWILFALTRLDGFSQKEICDQIEKIIKNPKKSALLRTFAAGVLLNIAMKKSTDTEAETYYQRWWSLIKEYIAESDIRCHFRMLIWCHLEATRNNALNFLIPTKIFSSEDILIIQDTKWLRYKKSLFDPQIAKRSERVLCYLLRLFKQVKGELTVDEQKKLELATLMLATLYYDTGRPDKGNQILEENDQHLTQLPFAMMWAEYNPLRVHEIWPSWQNKIRDNMYDVARLLRLSAMKYSNENFEPLARKNLEQSALLISADTQAWILLAKVWSKAGNSSVEKKILDEVYGQSYHNGRINIALAEFYARLNSNDAVYEALDDYGRSWECLVSYEMLKKLPCRDFPIGRLCFHFADNHASNNWHYEVEYWLEAACKEKYRPNEEEIKKVQPFLRQQYSKNLKIQKLLDQIFRK